MALEAAARRVLGRVHDSEWARADARCRHSRPPPSPPPPQRLELSSEQDLFFHYSHVLDERTFRAVREEQRLMIEFQDYPNVLARSLNQAIKEPHAHLAVFIMNRDGNARLDFIQVRGGGSGREGARVRRPPRVCAQAPACVCAGPHVCVRRPPRARPSLR